jgi:hypothetical protein
MASKMDILPTFVVATVCPEAAFRARPDDAGRRGDP